MQEKKHTVWDKVAALAAVAAVLVAIFNQPIISFWEDVFSGEEQIVSSPMPLTANKDTTPSPLPPPSPSVTASPTPSPSPSPVPSPSPLDTQKMEQHLQQTSGAPGSHLLSLRPYWYYYATGDESEDENVVQLFNFLYDEYLSIFGESYLSGIHCVIYNDPDAEGLRLIYHDQDTLIIRLHLTTTNHWCQLTYQLAQEMAHYVFKRTYDYMNTADSPWNEKILCQAFPLYMLHQLSEKWSDCGLSKSDAGYDASIRTYIEATYADGLQASLKFDGGSMSTQDFQELCERAIHNFDEFIAERNYAYNLLLSWNNSQIQSIAHMYRYLRGDGSIDFDQWEAEADDPDAIRALRKIQPIIA